MKGQGAASGLRWALDRLSVRVAVTVGLGTLLVCTAAGGLYLHLLEQRLLAQVGLQVQAAALRTGAVQVAVDAAESIAAAFPALTFRDEADRAAFFDGVRARAQALWQVDPIAVNYVQNSAVEANPGTSGFSQSVPGIGSMYVMLTILPAVGAFIRARHEGTIQRLVTMPVRRSQILGGMLLARFLLGLIQYGIVFGFGLFLGVRYGSDPLALILVMVSFTLCVTALMIALTGFIRTEMQATGITLFLGLTLAPLGGAWWPLDIVPEAMRIVGHISPIAWAMDAYHALIFYGGGLLDVLPSVAVLLGMAAILFAIGVRRFSFEG
jgi:ABC-2 type transport system permease protein